jgi:PTH2 family peptidyl-tRNA hydrolase
MKKAKQVIVWRKDLKVRKGKFGAQVAHAACALLLNAMEKSRIIEQIKMILTFKRGTPWDLWINGKFTKIVVGCENEGELLQIYAQAKSAGLPCVLITDAGLTEFDGVPTNTCVGIGPYWEEDINKITGHLPLM